MSTQPMEKPGTAVPEIAEHRLQGYIESVVYQGSFGFIEVASGERFFFHYRNLRGWTTESQPPQPGTIVTFRRFPVNIPGKKDRAIDVEVK